MKFFYIISNMKNSFSLFFIASVLLFSGCSHSIKKCLAPATSELDEKLLHNPDRGFRTEVIVRVVSKDDYTDNDFFPPQTDATQHLRNYLTYYEPESPVLAQLYFYLTDYNHTPIIPDEGINVMQANFDFARKEKIRLLVRFAYQTHMESAKGEAPQDIMLAHMQQLKPLLEKNNDVIHVIQAGFLGAWGEWHSHQLECDSLALLRGIIDMTPPDKFIQMRIPNYKNILPETDPDYNRISFHIDAIWGAEGVHWGTGGADPGTEQWEQMTRESPYLPVDGEMYWGEYLSSYNKFVDGFQVIKQLSEHRYTSFSLHHNYRENNPKAKYSMRYWQETEITPEWLDEHRIFYAPSWFKDRNGHTIKRSVFDFVQHYVGYKLEAKAFRAKTNKEHLEVEMDLVNYGFSACYGLESGFAILDANNRVVSVIEAGNPSNWHSRLAQDYNDVRLLTHTINAVIPLPPEKATYKIAFYLKNSLGSFARLSNNIDFENGYNILHVL